MISHAHLLYVSQFLTRLDALFFLVPMPTKTYDGTLLDHLAEHMISLSPSWLLCCLLPSTCCAILLSSLCASLLLHCLSSSSCCTLLSSSLCASWLLRCLLTRHHIVVSLSHRTTLLPSRCANWLSYHLLSSSLVGIGRRASRCCRRPAAARSRLA